jgi:hypothetical protein
MRTYDWLKAGDSCRNRFALTLNMGVQAQAHAPAV